MRFMMLVKGAEDAGMPPHALFDAIDKLIAEQLKSGALVDTGGLAPTAEGARVRSAGGTMSVTDGPFADAKEVIGGYAIFKAQSREEAIRLAQDFIDLHVQHWPEWECVCEVRQIAE